MKRLVVLIAFLAPALSAQWTPHNVRATTGDVDVIVEFRDPPLSELRGSAAKTSAMAQYEATFRRFKADAKISSNIRYEYYELFDGVAVTVPPQQIDAIRRLPYVKSVQFDVPVYALAAPLPPNVAKIRADQVWANYGTRGRGVVVAVIDTGIDYTHPALGGCLGPGCKVIGGYDFVNQDNDPKDDHFHGTHVAGIIAGDSDQILGVAPDVSLLAYKVLNSHGSGKTSDVIAGVERAADPNKDGDFSDHADVANLSLGGAGNPNDALSLAIDRGTSVGVVYCIAAGNSGSAYHTIGSPGGARTAITVGATDNNDVLASFSSRGPNSMDAALKPDVLAPGVSVVSSLPGAKYGPLSGTSMATPHVAGVAALLKALHRDWTPAQIKSAITDRATFLGVDIMAQGGGRVDALAAANATSLVTPGSISLGEDHLPLTTWSPTVTLQLENVGTQPAMYTIGAPSSPAVTVAANPSKVQLDPGASAQVTISYGMTNAQVFAGPSLAFGGIITITSNASVDVAKVPWAAVRAARVVVSYDKPFATAQLINRTAAPVVTPTIPLDSQTLEAFTRGATYDVLLTWESIDPLTFADTPSLANNDVRLHYLEAQTVNDDASFAMSSLQATHTIAFNGQNENGQPLATNDFVGYATTGRIVYPPGVGIPSLPLPPFLSSTWHVADFAENLLLQEINYDIASSRFYVLQYPALSGVHDDATLTGGGADLKRMDAGIALAPGSDQRAVVLTQTTAPAGDLSNTLGLALQVQAPQFIESVFLNPDVDPKYSVSALLESITDNVLRYITPQMRIFNGQISPLISGKQVTPWSYSADSLQFGSGIHFPRLSFAPGPSAVKPSLLTDFVGQFGEVRVGDHNSTMVTLYASDSSVQIAGTKYPMPLDFSQAGAFTITAVDTSLFARGIPRTSTVTATLDSSRSDFYPPTFTAMMLLDANSKAATHLDPHHAGTLLFSAADFAYSITPPTYQSIAGDQTKVWFRYSGAANWQPLTATQTGEDSQFGIAYRVDLTNVANAENVLVDMRFDIADAAGNTTSFVMAPAFAVGRDSWFGRRGPHR